MLAERTGKTTDKLQSESCEKYLSFSFHVFIYLSGSTHTLPLELEGRAVILWVFSEQMLRPQNIFTLIWMEN